MDSIKVAIIGAGSVRCGIPVIASLTTYFGERPLEIAFYDADEERLDLFFSLARMAFAYNKNPHSLRASTDPLEMLQGASRVILQLDENCARLESIAANSINGIEAFIEFRTPRDKNHRKRDTKGADNIERTLARIRHAIEPEADVVSLLPKSVLIPLEFYYRLDWPRELTAEERRGVPHQVLRWIRGEEYMVEALKENDRSPIKKWLDDAHTAILVSER